MSTGKWPAVVWFFFCLVIPAVADSSTQKAGDSPVKHVGPNEAQKLIAEKKVIVLDLRTPGEFKTVHIAGATNIDFLASDFEARIEQLDTNKSYLVHCASGGRSTRSLPVLHKHNFELLYHLDGGIKAWEKAGLPVEK
jgi:rhodanese-related sulfurtransferase